MQATQRNPLAYLSLFGCVRYFLSHLALISLLFEQFIFTTAFAQNLPISADGTTNTQVTQTASGIDQINIAAPNSAGLSHNNFTNYNVNASGQVINNFAGVDGAIVGASDRAVIQTEIGGLVTANSNLVNSGSAKVILNEVTSNNVSQLLGYIEIAGSNADLIIANPNGITCSGCGFINTSHLLMVAGSSNFDNEGNLGFNLREQKINPDLYAPLITVSGLGLDVELVSATEIIASSIKLISNIYAANNDLTLKSGEGRYDYVSKEIANSSNNNNSNNSALFAIDASALASIQAGRIFLIATREGVGVNMASEILAGNKVVIDANGDVYYSNIATNNLANNSNSINIKSSHKVESINNSSAISSANILIEANELKNLGKISANNLTIQNSDKLTNLGTIEAFNLNLSNINHINNSNLLYGENYLNIRAVDLTNVSAGNIFSLESYSIALSGIFTNFGNVSSKDNLTIIGTSAINNAGLILSNNALSVTASSLTNNDNSVIKSFNSSLKITLTNDLDNSGILKSTNDLNIDSRNFINSGDIVSNQNLGITNSNNFTNSGNIISNQNLATLSLGNFTNSGNIYSSQKLNITALDFTNNALGEIISDDDLTIFASGNFINRGIIGSNKSLEIKSLAFENFNKITSLQNLDIYSRNKFINSGNIASNQYLTITSLNDFENIGNISSDKNLNITSSNEFINSGIIGSNWNITINDLNGNNSGNIKSVKNLTITSQGNFINSNLLSSNQEISITGADGNNSGAIISNQNLTITNSNNFTNSGNIASNQYLTIYALNIENLNGAIESINDLTIASHSAFTNSGNITSNQNLIITSQNGFTNNLAGKLISNNNIDINSHGVFTNYGMILSANNLDLTLDSLTNEGEISAYGNLTINDSGSLINSNRILANGSSNIASNSLVNNKNSRNNNKGGVIASNNSYLKLTVTNHLQNDGELSSINNLDINNTETNLDITSNSLTNLGNILSSGKLNINTTNLLQNSNELLNISGNLQSVNDLSITSGSLDNYGSIKSFAKSIIDSASINNRPNAIIYSSDDLKITANSAITTSLINSGYILSAAKFDLTAKSIDNKKEIFSSSDLKFTLTGYFNNFSLSKVSSFSKVDINNTANIRNDGQILSNGNLAIEANDLLNLNDIESGGTLALNLNSLNNRNKILSGGNFNINANELNNYLSDGNIYLNSGDIRSRGTLALNLGNLSNWNKIISNGVFNINASGNVTNSAILQSSNNFTIHANILTNNASSLIIADEDLTVVANIIVNQNTKPLTSNDRFGITSSNGILELQTDNLNNNFGLLLGKSINIKNLHGTSLEFFNDSGRVIASSAININLNNYNYINNGEIAADIITLTANNIANHKIISATNNLTLNATGGNINNYDNSKIEGGSGITTINALNGNINNLYQTSTFSSNNAAIFNSRNLNNSGAILASGNLTINLTNNLDNNQSALIWSGKNSIFNIANNFSNKRNAYIYSQKNLTIQKNNSFDSNQNKIESLENNSGTITTYEGDISIKAKIINNQRDSIDYKLISVATNSSNNENERFYEGGWYGWVEGGWFGLTLIRFDWVDHPYQSRYGYLIEDGWQQDSSIDKTVVTKRFDDPTNLFSKINSGGDIFIESINFNNRSSEITANRNITLNASTFNNESIAITNSVSHTCYTSGTCYVYDFISLDPTILNFNQRTDLFHNGNVVKDPNDNRRTYQLHDGESHLIEVASSSTKSSIKAGGFLLGTISSKIDNNITQNSIIDATNKTEKSTGVNAVNLVMETGIINIDLTSISSAIGDKSNSQNSSSLNLSNTVSKTASEVNGEVETSSKNTLSNSDSKDNSATILENVTFSGLFKITLNNNPNQPLVEARSQFTDITQFFGSKYYFDQLGLNGANVLADIDRQTRNVTATKILGDSFVETKLILDQLRSLTNDSLLLSKDVNNNSIADALAQNNNKNNAQIKELIDNSISEFARLGLNAETVAMNGLTQSQVNSLTKDIITFETIVVNGINVLAPKVYLSLDSRNRIFGNSNDGVNAIGNLASGSTIFAAGDLTINSPLANMTNSGSIISGSNLLINVDSFSNISNSAFSSNQISSITQIKSEGNLTIISNNDAINNSGITLKNTLLDSAGKISLISNNNILITQKGSDPFLQNSLLFEISSLSETSLSSSTKDRAATARASLTFNAGSDIQITSVGNINIANNYFNSGGSIFMNAGSDINNSNYTIKASNNIVMNAVNINNIATNPNISHNQNETKIEAGNIVSLNAQKDSNGNGGNINNIGATIKGGNLVYLTAENDINNMALVDYKINGNSTNAGGSAISESQALTSDARYISSNLVSKGNITSDGDLVMVANNNINVKASNITSAENSYLEAANGDINITTTLLRDKTFAEGGSKKKRWVSVSDNVTNIESNITSGGNLDLVAGGVGNINIIGSNLSSSNDLTLTSSNNITIANAVNSSYNEFSSTKKGFSKRSDSFSKDYIETAFDSNLLAENITLNSNNSLIQSSNLNTTNNLNTSNTTNLIIQDAKLNEYHYAQTSRSYHGISEIAAKTTSYGIGFAAGMTNASYNVVSPILTNIDDLNQNLAGRVLPASLDRKITDNIDAHDLKHKFDDRLTNNSLYNIKHKTIENIQKQNISESNLNAGNDLNITAQENVVIQASNIDAKNDIGITTNNLYILADQSFALGTAEDKKTRTLMFKNNNNGALETNSVTSEIVSGSGGFEFNVDRVVVSYDGNGLGDGGFANVGNSTNTSNNSTNANSDYLTYLKNNKSDVTLFNPVNEVAESWNRNNRGLTDVGTAVVVIGAVSTTVITGGAALGVVGTAVASSAAATASVSATNSSMNVQGSFLSSVDDVGKTTLKDTTSKKSLQNMVIAGITAGVASGVSEYYGLAEMSQASNAANAVEATRTASKVIQNLKISLIESALSNATSSVVQSAISGDSSSNTLNNLALNIAIGAFANAAAKEIGNAAHPMDQYGNPLSATISTSEQLALHAVLGCAAGASQGGDCTSGAAAGVVGEMVGTNLRSSVADSSMNRQTAIQLAGLSGSAATLFASAVTNQSDTQTANNIFAGQRIGSNATENNAYFGLRPLRGSPWLGPLSHNNLDDKTNTEIAHEQLFFEDIQGGNIGFSKEGLFEESGSVLQEYKITQSGFDDTLMREAIQNVQPKPYSLLGIGSCNGKYNCQDWSSDVRTEYYHLENQRNLSIWNQMTQP